MRPTDPTALDWLIGLSAAITGILLLAVTALGLWTSQQPDNGPEDWS